MHLSRFTRHLIHAMFAYLRLHNNELEFLIDDPVPKNDPVDGDVSKDFFAIFDATKHDPDFKPKRGKYNIVTDGNLAMSRGLCPDERPVVTKNGGWQA